MEEHDGVEYHRCMSVAQLHEVLAVAAWTHPHAPDSTATMKKAVILTSCSLSCMQHYMESFLKGIERSRDGDFSQHIIVVAYGMGAYLYCDALRHTHKHHCVLDRGGGRRSSMSYRGATAVAESRGGGGICAPPNAPLEWRGERNAAAGHAHEHESAGPSQTSAADVVTNPINGIVYWLGVHQRIEWAALVVAAGISVMWSDMDVHYFGNPLEFFAKNTPDADIAFEPGYFWEGLDNMFRGAVCKGGGRGSEEQSGCVPETNWTSPADGPVCCRTNDLNSGIWLVNPTPSGARFMRAWRAIMFEQAIVQRKVFIGSMEFDFVKAYDALGCDPRQLYDWNSARGEYVPAGFVTCDEGVGPPLMYRVSGQVFMSWCTGACGLRNASGLGLTNSELPGWDGYYVQADGSRTAHSNDDTTHKVCAMPRKYQDRLVAFHLCCLSSAPIKAREMRLWLNVTFDEALFDAYSRAHGRGVHPDW
ncbi:hypothetical protein FOA52_004069 [Chlamydomonas sp. UWO 241]|nr:hypothetical protein FOA52_004069 [Chlamydomonas sp. UWO 241]